jgi:hypothetical protein
VSDELPAELRVVDQVLDRVGERDSVARRVRERDEPNSRRQDVVCVFIALGAAPADDELVEMLSNLIREQQERAIAGDARA